MTASRKKMKERPGFSPDYEGIETQMHYQKKEICLRFSPDYEGIETLLF
ncbi:hypothetical protein SULAZ_1043 [Sulfurihydrogenibium azorense Az-Fu1]|uniref:Uncharacterized protein n=1 Tax=Sulfurihydrogenibium azorense (strain DSM 15241 / OCM 825 / Az-Fu1) TaxID=204536 RepID=C1DV79_SULAA|nr:hypothetical protein SULAZ_1043 [Sulfurihydrogenibium azorense Az-Fu1]